ncbi:hypothetical protein [Hyphomicrobium sp.]|uniref:hypothetical protein n=1 Tax=Hyphomicrobium sp. TaxID=82 RepID=UPI0025C5EA53|nr:hypothetical protein [Hyphomicrobium sp.]
MSNTNDAASEGNEGGEKPLGPEEFLIFGDLRYGFMQPTNAELALVRIRLIALENLVIALLAEASPRQLEVVREMAAYISPRPGFTHHPLTSQAAVHMLELAQRASHFGMKAPS